MSKKGAKKHTAAEGQEEKPPEQERADEETPTSEESETPPDTATDEGSGADARSEGPGVAAGLREGDREGAHGDDGGVPHVGDDADLTVQPEDQADPEPAPPPEEVPRGPEVDPTYALRQAYLGNYVRGEEFNAAGALVSLCYREKKWRDAVALRISGIREGVVLIDLETDDHQAVLAVPFGDTVRCWKFRGA